MTSDSPTPERPHSSDADPGARRRTLLIAVGAAVVLAVVIVIAMVAAGGDDEEPATTTELVIQSPASVTGITGVAPAGDGSVTTLAGAVPVSGSTAPGASNADGTTYVLQRQLLAPGQFDCVRTGSWQPFAEVVLQFAVGEPAPGSTCGDTVLDLPAGSCSAEPCNAVPENWTVVEAVDVTPQALMLIVAPTEAGATTAQFLCVKESVPQLKQILPVGTSIQDACASATIDSVDIPYVPPPTGDLPAVTTGDTIDLPDD